MALFVGVIEFAPFGIVTLVLGLIVTVVGGAGVANSVVGLIVAAVIFVILVGGAIAVPVIIPSDVDDVAFSIDVGGVLTREPNSAAAAVVDVDLTVDAVGIDFAMGGVAVAVVAVEGDADDNTDCLLIVGLTLTIMALARDV